MEVKETLTFKRLWRITRYNSEADYEADTPYDVSEFEGNLLLNEGIQLLEDLLIGAGGTAYNNANAYLGVGEDNTAESASQTGLLGASKTFKAMEATYPQRSSQTLTWRAVFASGDANNAWNEFTVVNASSDTGTNLNRKVSAQGTKASGQVWTLDLQLTIS